MISNRSLPLASLLFAATVLAACVPRGASTQSTVASIPEPLVTALIEPGYTGSRPAPHYFVAELPTGFPSSLVPAGPVQVIGGMMSARETIVILADSSRRLAAVFQAMLERSGWTKPAPTPGSGFYPGSGPNSYFCRDSMIVSAEPLSGAERSFIRVTYRPDRGHAACQPQSPHLDRSQLALPALTAPKDVHVGRSRGGSGTDEAHSSAQMSGSGLALASIVQHYAAQLVTAGWTVNPPAVSERVVAQFLEARDASGGAWEGTLVATGSATEVNLSLTMHPRGRQ